MDTEEAESTITDSIGESAADVGDRHTIGEEREIRRAL